MNEPNFNREEWCYNVWKRLTEVIPTQASRYFVNYDGDNFFCVHRSCGNQSAEFLPNGTLNPTVAIAFLRHLRNAPYITRNSLIAWLNDAFEYGLDLATVEQIELECSQKEWSLATV